MSEPKTVIVKVQLPIWTNAPGLDVYAYTRDRSVMIMKPATDEIIAAMGDAKKKFFRATIDGRDLVLGDELPDQGW